MQKAESENIAERRIPKRIEFVDRKNRYTPALMQLFSDLATLPIAAAIAFFLRFETDLIGSGFPSADPKVYVASLAAVALVLAVYWLFLFWIGGMYRNWYKRSPFDEFFNIVKITFIGSFLIFLFANLDSENSPRALFLANFVIFAFMTNLGRFVVRKLQRFLRIRRIVSIPTLIVGTGERALDLYEKLERSPEWGYLTKGFVSIDRTRKPDDNFASADTPPLLGGIDDLESIIDKEKPGEIVIAAKNPDHDSLMRIASICSDYRLDLEIEPDIYDMFSGQVKTLHVYGAPLIQINAELMKPWEAFFKRALDIVFSLLVLVVGLPIWALFAAIIRLESKGPAIYKQQRLGKDQEVFTMYKFRSMRPFDSKGKQTWTKVNDPRVTKFGRFLRKTHLDEIPQFFNVLIGDMSVVGPRPEQPQLAAEFMKEIPYFKRRLKVRPGITGFWQVKYRPHVLDKKEMISRLQDDFYYIENMSLALDIEIIARTVVCVVRGHGQA